MTKAEKLAAELERITYLKNVASDCVRIVTFKAGLCDKDSNTVLRDVIGRLTDAISEIHQDKP